MRRVLFLAYHFPPVGGAGVQRSAKFARHLPELGYEPVVVTGPGPEREDRWTPEDASLERDLPSGLTILRIPQRRPAPSTGTRARAERWLRVPSPFTAWWTEGTLELARGAGDVDLVYASLSPYDSAAAASRIAAQLGRPWVADLRDPWALDEMQVHPSRLHQHLERRGMRRSLSSAAALVMNTPEAAARLVAAFPELATKPIRVIPNGYDAGDFVVPPEPRSDSAFRIVHTGYLHTDLGHDERRRARLRRVLGGTTQGVDILARSHVFVLDAIEQVRGELPGIEIELHLAGIASSADHEAGRSEAVRFRGYLPHAETVALMRSADLLFLPMHDLPPGKRATIVPGKTYEYLGSGRPVLAAVPDGDARDLLMRIPNAYLTRPRDTAAMATVLRELVRAKQEHGPAPDARSELAEPYERKRLSAELGAVFDGVLATVTSPRNPTLAQVG